jgi:hypothetical protein
MVRQGLLKKCIGEVRSQETGFRIQDSGFRIQDSGFRIQEIIFICSPHTPIHNS